MNYTREELSYDDLKHRYAKLCHNTDYPVQVIWDITEDKERNLISCYNYNGELIYACVPGVVPNNEGFCVGEIEQTEKGTRAL